MSSLKRAAVPLFLAVFLSPAFASSASRDHAALLRLSPATRMEQRCNEKAMGAIGREQKTLHPDELVAYAYASTAITGATIRAPGAAVRSGGKWYHLSYTCQTSQDGTEVKAFDYALGTVIPRSEWAEHYLVP